VAFPTATDVLSAIAENTAVTRPEVARFIAAAVGRLGANHEGGVAPANGLTEALVWDHAYYRALKLHLNRDGVTDTASLDKDLDRIEARFVAYDADNSATDERETEAPVATLTRVPWSA
jgi:hypothetical protein